MMSMRVLLLAFLPLAACTRQLYDGPARPDSEVARITSHSASAYRVYVREIDGEKAGFRWKQGRTHVADLWFGNAGWSLSGFCGWLAYCGHW